MVRRWVLDKASLVHARCSSVVGLTRQDLLQGATILALDSFTIVYPIIRVFFKVNNTCLQRFDAARLIQKYFSEYSVYFFIGAIHTLRKLL